jgi:RNA 2',3'-cyclic 3'-phosphodiesterase
LFAALLPPPAVVEHLAAAVTPIRDDVIRWTEPESWHLTLAFYGDLEAERVGDLTTRLVRAAGRYAPMQLSLSGVRRFGRGVLWVGCRGDTERLRQLADSVAAAGRRIGAKVDDGRSYRPHVTLARSAGRVDLRSYVDRLAGYAGPPWTAKRVELVQSVLGAGKDGRPRYQTVATFDLAE